MHNFKGIGRKDIKPHLSAGKNKENQWDDKEADTNDEEEKPDGDNNKKNAPLLRFTKIRCLSAAEKKPPLKRRVTRRRYSWSLLSDDIGHLQL